MEPVTPEMEEVLKIIQELKPNWQPEVRGSDSGRGMVRESIFAFGCSGNYYWIVILYRSAFAFKPITPAWIQTYSNLILSSPEVSVEYDRCHRITAWSVEQDKEQD